MTEKLINANNSKEQAKQQAQEIDKKIGQKIREIRKALKMSQEELAGAVGVTFQQIQKYERGSNRVSGSMMFLMARVLQVKVERFFEDIAEQPPEGTFEAAAVLTTKIMDDVKKLSQPKRLLVAQVVEAFIYK